MKKILIFCVLAIAASASAQTSFNGPYGFKGPRIQATGLYNMASHGKIPQFELAINALGTTPSVVLTGCQVLPGSQLPAGSSSTFVPVTTASTGGTCGTGTLTGTGCSIIPNILCSTYQFSASCTGCDLQLYSIEEKY